KRRARLLRREVGKRHDPCCRRRRGGGGRRHIWLDAGQQEDALVPIPLSRVPLAEGYSLNARPAAGWGPPPGPALGRCGGRVAPFGTLRAPATRSRNCSGESSSATSSRANGIARGLVVESHRLTSRTSSPAARASAGIASPSSRRRPSSTAQTTRDGGIVA